MDYLKLLREERMNLNLLQQKIKGCKTRIKAFETVMNSFNTDNELPNHSDDRDSVISSSLPEIYKIPNAIFTSKRLGYLRRNSVGLKVLEYLLGGEKSLEELVSYFPNKKRTSLVTLIWDFRRKGLLTNLRPGVYLITKLGEQLIEKLKERETNLNNRMGD